MELFNLRYTKIHGVKKTYDEIAIRKNYYDGSGILKIIKPLRLRFLRLVADYNFDQLHDKEKAIGGNSDITPDDDGKEPPEIGYPKRKK